MEICELCMEEIVIGDDGHEHCGCEEECPCGCEGDEAHCVYSAQHSVQATVAAPWACPSCSHENHAMAIKCYFCDATAPNA